MSGCSLLLLALLKGKLCFGIFCNTFVNNYLSLLRLLSILAGYTIIS